jgi:alkylation response protein AidB-like acyl-CoA dehydrogenase
MDFNLSPDEEAFRQEVRTFLAENLGEGERDMATIAGFQKKVREKRWVGFSWPKEYGGGGGSIMEQVILKEEMAKAKAPPLGTCFMGLAWVGPAIIEYGTPEQKKKFIPDILDGAYQWCTGYSEPASGSDLASLSCRCEREGDTYVVNGQKIWTSIAMWSNWIILLVRTQTEVKSKHDGITCLLVPMDTKGDYGWGPFEYRRGEEGQGWGVTVSALAHERSSIAEVHGLSRILDDVKDLARRCRKNGRPAAENAGIRRRIARAEMRIEAMRLNGLRFLTKQLRGEKLGSETSINKLHRAELEVELGELALEIQGSRGPLWQGSDVVPDDGRWQRYALSWPEVVIGGGTPNIQKNIIAERVLGLPKD